jgi:ABC-type amino acid transport substrate-binding protein
MNFYDDSGKLTGFDTELAEAVCANLGINADSLRSTGIPRKSSSTQRISTVYGTECA